MTRFVHNLSYRVGQGTYTLEQLPATVDDSADWARLRAEEADPGAQFNVAMWRVLVNCWSGKTKVGWLFYTYQARDWNGHLAERVLTDRKHLMMFKGRGEEFSTVAGVKERLGFDPQFRSRGLRTQVAGLMTEFEELNKKLGFEYR